jgi:predicted PurR-regulated permease PerM
MKMTGFSGLVHIICSLLIGLLLFLLLDPIVCLLVKKQGVKRSAVPGIVFALLLAFTVGIAIFIFPILKNDAITFVKKLPDAADAIDETVQLVFDKMFGAGARSSVRVFLEDSFISAKEKSFRHIGRIFENAALILKNIAVVVIDIVTGVIFAYYFIKDKEKIGEHLLGIFPYSRRNDVVKVVHDIGNIISSFIKGQFTVAVIVGVTEAFGLWLIGVPVPWLFGIIGGISNLIPYIGPFIGAVPAAFAALMVSPWRALLTVLLFVLVQQLDNNFISPKIIEGKLGVHPVASIIVLFISGELWGLFGILLGIPLYAVLRYILRYFVERRIKKCAKP